MYSYANLSRICRPSYKKKPANVRDWKEWSVLRHIRMFGMCVVGVGRAFLWCPALHTPQPRSICQSEHTGCSPQCCLTHPEWPSDKKSHLGGRPMMGQGFQKADHKARALIFNPTFILRFSIHHISGTQKLVAICLFFYVVAVVLFFSLSSASNSLFMENNIEQV